MAGARPSGFKSAGGFLNGVDGVITNYEFTTDIPGGGSPKKGSDFTSLFFRLSVKIDGVDDEQQTSLFVGSADDFEIEDDGKTLVPVDDNGGLRANSNFSFFIDSLVKAGFPESNLPEDSINFEAIIGTRCRFKQEIDEAAMKRLGKQKSKDGKKEYNRTRPAVEQVYALPKGGGNTKAPKASGGDLDKVATESLVALLKKAPNKTLLKKKLPVQIINQVGAKHPQRNEIKDLVTSDDFLSASDAWGYDEDSQEITLA